MSNKSLQGCLLPSSGGAKEGGRREEAKEGGRREDSGRREDREAGRREEYKESGRTPSKEAGRREEYKEGGRREEYKEARREDLKEGGRIKEDFKDSARREEGGRREEVRETGNGSALWLGAAGEEVKGRHPAEREAAEVRPDFDLPEPPLEYCEARRLGDGGERRGILSSIFDKVRSKEEPRGRGGGDCLPFGGKEEHRRSQPLLDNIIDCTGTFRGKEDKEELVGKPYEPPALGKSSRITPVGGEEAAAASSQSGGSSCLEADSVEVLSVIR